MKIRGQQITHVETEVALVDIIDAAAIIIREKAGLRHDRFWVRDDGELMEEIEAYHGSDWSEARGKATELQKRALDTIRSMRDIYYGR